MPGTVQARGASGQSHPNPALVDLTLPKSRNRSVQVTIWAGEQGEQGSSACKVAFRQRPKGRKRASLVYLQKKFVPGGTASAKGLG